MSEISEDIIDGTMCSLCGCYFTNGKDQLYSHGYPVVCWDCWEELPNKEREDLQRAVVDTF